MKPHLNNNNATKLTHTYTHRKRNFQLHTRSCFVCVCVPKRKGGQIADASNCCYTFNHCICINAKRATTCSSVCPWSNNELCINVLKYRLCMSAFCSFSISSSISACSISDLLYKKRKSSGFDSSERIQIWCIDFEIIVIHPCWWW